MTNLEKYNKAFRSALGAGDADLGPDMVYQRYDGWDSVGHMDLISELEERFDIQLETLDVTSFNTYEAGKAILAKYGVEL